MLSLGEVGDDPLPTSPRMLHAQARQVLKMRSFLPDASDATCTSSCKEESTGIALLAQRWEGNWRPLGVRDEI